MKVRSKVINWIYSLIPDNLILMLILGKNETLPKFFVSSMDILTAKKKIIGSILTGLILCSALNLLLKKFSVLSILLALLFVIVSIFVLMNHIHSTIASRYKKFDEMVFILINSLSIGVLIHQSLFYSIDLLLKNSFVKTEYDIFLGEIIANANLGEDENLLLQKSSKKFFTEEYRKALEHLSNGRYIKSNPRFLARIKREISTVEDNIVIFIAVSCLFPLALSMIIPLVIDSNSLSLFLFPLIFGLFGSLFLRFIQGKSGGRIEV